jgi:uncharacterized Zn-finger protein
MKFHCDKCSDVLSSSQSLKRHIRTVHEVLVKNFSCHICSKEFKDNDYLQRHLRVHETADKTFVCQECGKFFKYKARSSFLKWYSEFSQQDPDFVQDHQLFELYR